ncbi:response regulator [Breoghania sp. L-A4]|uniref:response regulator n=1 Tax=Breoghania sp. L-A4 TaxID=2304600 RepID=UPI0013C2D79C|nr:response regulator [Breoghania sp. L-A4]
MIVDDDEDDIYLMDRAICRLEESGDFNIDLKLVLSGSEAVGEIDRGLVGHILPDKIFLDLNMPGVSGFDVLRHCKEHEILDKVAVVVITTASDQETHQAALDCGATCVRVKPHSFQELSDLFADLLDIKQCPAT